MTEDPAHTPLTEAEQAYYNQLDEDVTAGRVPTIGRGTRRDGSRVSLPKIGRASCRERV